MRGDRLQRLAHRNAHRRSVVRRCRRRRCSVGGVINVRARSCIADGYSLTRAINTAARTERRRGYLNGVNRRAHCAVRIAVCVARAFNVCETETDTGDV